MSRFDHPVYGKPRPSPVAPCAQLLAMLSPAQLRSLREEMDSPSNLTWLRSHHVTDNQIRQAVAEVAVRGHNDLEHVFAMLIVMLNQERR